MARHPGYYRSPFGDTTYTKVFVGGLAWETPTEEMRKYFEQFGDILEAVVIADKNTGKSKGYGFVTFRDPESATRACANPNPVIDGRRANCNIASLGRPGPPPPRGRNSGGNKSEYEAGGGTAYTGMATPVHSPMLYPPYGYAYAPDQYGHRQGLYNAPVYGAASASGMMGSPYYYGPRPRGGVPQLAHPLYYYHVATHPNPPFQTYPLLPSSADDLEGGGQTCQETEAADEGGGTGPESSTINTKETSH